MKALFITVFFALSISSFSQETVFIGTSTQSNRGTIFKTNQDGTANEVWHSARLPQQGYDVQLISLEGKLYGTTTAGGADGDGILFRINKDGTDYEVLHEFSETDGARPFGGVLFYEGRLWGTAETQGPNSSGTLYSVFPDGSDFKVEYDFTVSGGSATQLVLTQSKLYGTTFDGIFSFDTNSSEFTIIHDFGSSVFPKKLFIASNNFFYGVTGFDGFGTLYRIKPDGSEYEVLHEFGFGTDNTFNPFSTLSEVDGRLFGGSFSDFFSINLDGTDFRIDYRPPSGGDFSRDFRGGVIESDGKLWGITFGGGASMVGSIYSTDTDGSNLTKVLDFDLEKGSLPWSTFLVEDNRLWGISTEGGLKGNGTIFSIKNDGTDFQKIHDFNDSGTDGRVITGELLPTFL